MTPNLYVAARSAMSHLRVKRHRQQDQAEYVEFEGKRYPLTYTCKNGRGWCLAANVPSSSSSVEGHNPSNSRSGSSTPTEVVYCHTLHRYLLEPEYRARTLRTHVQGYKGEVTVFRHDDGVTWVVAEDEDGNFVPGPWERLFWDRAKNEFRPMRKGDDPVWQSRRNSPAGTGGQTPMSAALSPDASRPVSRGRNENVQGIDRRGATTKLDLTSHAEALKTRLGEEAARKQTDALVKVGVGINTRPLSTLSTAT